MDEPLLWLGGVACGLLAGAGLLPLDRRLRLGLLCAAVALAPILIAADNWRGEQLTELRESPLLLIAAGAGATVVVGGLTALLVRWPRLLPLLAIAALPFRVPVQLAETTSNLLLPLYAVIAAGLIAAWLGGPARGEQVGEAPGVLRWVAPALAAFVVAYALQAGYAVDVSPAIETIAFFLAPFAALYFLLSTVRWDARLLRESLAVLLVVALVVTAVGFGQYATRELFWNEKVIAGNEAHTWFRVNSLFWDPNIMGRYLALTMALVAVIAVFARARRELIAAAALFAVLLLALTISFSQTSMLALLAGLAVLAAARWGIAPGALATVGVIAGIGLAMVAIEGGGLAADTSGRTGLVSGGIDLVEERPLRGHGSGSFADEFGTRFDSGGEDYALESHTEPLTVAAEQGAVGLLPYSALLVVSLGGLALAAGIGSGRPPARPAAALLTAYSVMVVHSIGYAAFFTDPITWALLAVGTAVVAGTPSSGNRPGVVNY